MTEPSALLHGIKQALSVTFLIKTFGYPGLFVTIFAETGLMLGFFLPGDSLLITAGIFASKGYLNILILLPLLFIAATLGNMVGYAIGHGIGKKLLKKQDTRFFRHEHIESAKKFYEKHGGKAIILARFIPIIRTFAPIVAGIIEMRYATFMLFNVLGSLLWAICITLMGFFLGRFIPDKYFSTIILVVIFVSLAPGFYELLKNPANREKIVHHVRRLVRRKS